MKKPRALYKPQTPCAGTIKKFYPPAPCALPGRWTSADGKTYCHMHHPETLAYKAEEKRQQEAAKRKSIEDDIALRRERLLPLADRLGQTALAYCEAEVPHLVQEWMNQILANMIRDNR